MGKSKTEIKRETLKTQVYDYLKDQITLGNFKPGERLIEEKIAETLDVSRSPIREAVRLLEKDGLINVNKTGGVTVANPSIEDYQYLYECRVEMESLAAYYAALRRTDEQVEKIRSAYLKMGKVQSPEELKIVHNANSLFHQSIIEASGNPFLLSMLTQMRGVNSFYRKAILEVEPMHMGTALLEHQQIFQAIIDQDADLAKELMKHHIESDYKLFMKLFRSM